MEAVLQVRFPFPGCVKLTAKSSCHTMQTFQHKEPGVVMCAYHLRTRVAEARRSLELAGQLYW